ncbi:MAG: CvpA family protein [Magnetococcales bacterium]|nr:CvpA family protein [Magnetococcales bacterium]
MSGFDYFLLLVVAFSALFAALKGGGRESWALAGWLLALGLALGLAVRLEPWLTPLLPDPPMVGTVGFLVILVGIKLVAWLLELAVVRLRGHREPSPLSRMAGLFFGLTRGMVLLLAGFVVFLSFDIPPPKMISGSLLARHGINGAHWIGGWQAPESVLAHRLRESYRAYRDLDTPSP